MRERRNFIWLLMAACLMLVMAFFWIPGTMEADDAGFISGGIPIDLILVIDESGSMKTNDPYDLRVDAARLFIELNQILTEGNRVSVAGFGEATNIYIEPAEVAMNKQEIMEALSSIKSNQKYTDMKAVLEEVKSMLDDRIKKNYAVVIFLTDGDLGIDDIPIPEGIKKESTSGGEKPEPPSRDTGGQEEGTREEDEDTTPDEDGAGEKLDQYLEEYKEELFRLCHEYGEDGIKIFPIAFTGQANTDVLQEIADITGSRMWVSQTAADVRNVYLDIFKYITSTFISVVPQEGEERLTGDVELSSYIRKAAAVAVSNENTSDPYIELVPPSPAAHEKIAEIDGATYSIRVVESPGKGRWRYNVSGDLVLALDAADIILADPLKALYYLDSEVPLVVQLSYGDAEDGADYSDFQISCTIEYPEGSSSAIIDLLDDGTGIDGEKDDGVFSSVFQDTALPGEYIIEFTIRHLPTGSSSLKKTVFAVTDYQPVKKELYLKVENSIITGTPVNLEANLEDFSAGAFSYKITGPSGDTSGGLLSDDGASGDFDDVRGDGIYSSSIGGFDEPGEYTITVEAGYESLEGFYLVQTKEVTLGKYIDITLVPDSIMVNTEEGTATVKLRTASLYDSDISLNAGGLQDGDDIISRLELEQDYLEAGAQQDIGLIIYLDQEIQEGDYKVTIPLVIGGIYTKDIEVDISVKKETISFDIKTLTGLILTILSLVPLILLLYTVINMKKLNIKITHPRVLVESGIFVVLFAAGMVVIFI